MRLFIAMLLSEEARQAIVARERRLRNADDQPPQLAWTPPDKLHLTLKFLGEVEAERVDEVARALQRLAAPPPMTLRPERMVLLPPRRPRIVAAELGGETAPLRQVVAEVEAICAAAGFPPEGRPWLAHLTLARCRNGLSLALARRLEEAAASLFPLADFTPEGTWLMESQLSSRGSLYLPVARLG